MSKYRIKGGELRGVNPVVVRTYTGTSMELKLNGVSAGNYADGSDVRISVVLTSGSQSGPTPQRLTVNYGSKYTELTFSGTAVWSLDGDYLVVDSTGLLTVDSGAGTLPATQAELRAASLVEWLCSSDDDPHRP